MALCLECGDLHNAVARIRRDACGTEGLQAISSTRRFSLR